MIHYTEKEEVQTVQELVFVECDVCGEQYEEDSEIGEMNQVHFTSGNHSVFGSHMHIVCDICQYCLHDMIADYVRITPDNTWGGYIDSGLEG